MKKIILAFLVFLIMSASVFAETTLDFTSDKQNYDIEDTIHINIWLSTDSSWENQISINWLDNFEVIWKRQSQSRKSINWKSSTQFNLQLSLLAKKSWEYTLWPISVQTGSGKIESNTVKIKVTGERIMVNNRIQNAQQQVWSGASDDEDENIDDVVLDNKDALNSSSSWKTVKAKKIYWVDWEEMSNIYTKKWFLSWKVFSKNSLIFLLITIFWILFYIILQKYFNNYLHSKAEIKIEEKEKVRPHINYKKLIENLEHKYIDSDKETFFAQTTKVLRTYLDDKVKHWLSKWSLKEVEVFLNRDVSEKPLYSKIINFYKKVYFPEYALWEDNRDERKHIIEELENIIITKIFK